MNTPTYANEPWYKQLTTQEKAELDQTIDPAKKTALIQQLKKAFATRRRNRFIQFLILAVVTIGVVLIGLGYWTSAPNTNTTPILPITDSPALAACKSAQNVVEWPLKNGDAYELDTQLPACPATGCTLRIQGASLAYALLLNPDSRDQFVWAFNIIQLQAWNPGFNPQAEFSGYIATKWWGDRLAEEFLNWINDNSANSLGADLICIDIPSREKMDELMPPLGISWETFNNAQELVNEKALPASPFDGRQLLEQARLKAVELNCQNLKPAEADQNQLAKCIEQFSSSTFEGAQLIRAITEFYKTSPAQTPTPLPTNLPTVIPTPTLIMYSPNGAEVWSNQHSFKFNDAIPQQQSTDGYTLYAITVDNNRTIYVNSAKYCENSSHCYNFIYEGEYVGTAEIYVSDDFTDQNGVFHQGASWLTVWNTQTKSYMDQLSPLYVMDGRNPDIPQTWFMSDQPADGVVNTSQLAALNIRVSRTDCGINGTGVSITNGSTEGILVTDGVASVCQYISPPWESIPADWQAILLQSGNSYTPGALSSPYVTVCTNGINFSDTYDPNACWSMKAKDLAQ